MGLKNRVYDIQDTQVEQSDSTERILETTKKICDEIIGATEHDIKTGHYSIITKKFLGITYAKFGQVRKGVQYSVLYPPRQITPYFEISAWYLKNEQEKKLFESTIIKFLEKEGFRCWKYKGGYGDHPSIEIEFIWKLEK